MSREIHVGTKVYVPIEYGEGRIYGEVVAERVANTETGQRLFTVHWSDGDMTDAYVTDLQVEDQ